MIVLASNAATQSYGITAAGRGRNRPPPHSHDWDEAFYVLKGEIQFLCDGMLTPATLVLSFTFPEESCMDLATEAAVVRCLRLQGLAR